MAETDLLDADALNALGAAWAASGAMWLTGRATGPPLGAPAGLVSGVLDLDARFHDLARRRGRAVTLDSLALLGERAALAGLRRQGDVSCGGGTHMLPTLDGTWVALTLARDDDSDLLAAWLEDDTLRPHDAWERAVAGAANRTADDLVGRAALVGLACARLGEVAPPATDPIRCTPRGSDGDRPTDRPLVVDLSSLWAGPLCAQLLGLTGMRVVKIESTRRPDGARRGSAQFFDVLHAEHEHVALDLTAPDGHRALRRLLERADVVITSSRPRALAEMGCAPDSIAGPLVWLEITAHGDGDVDRLGRVGFGDDIAVAGGVVAHDSDGPCFVADAVADPVSGLAGAVGVLDRLSTGGSWHLELAMARLAASVSTGPIVGAGHDVARPRARSATGRAPTLGEHTGAVMAALDR